MAGDGNNEMDLWVWTIAGKDSTIKEVVTEEGGAELCYFENIQFEDPSISKADKTILNTTYDVVRKRELPVGTRTDLIRFLVLVRFGGIYLDLPDARPMRSLIPLLHYNFFASCICIDTDMAVELSVIGSKPYSKVILIALRSFYERPNRNCGNFQILKRGRVDVVGDQEFKSSDVSNCFVHTLYDAYTELCFEYPGPREFFHSERAVLFPSYSLLFSLIRYPQLQEFAWVRHEYTNSYEGLEFPRPKKKHRRS